MFCFFFKKKKKKKKRKEKKNSLTSICFWEALDAVLPRGNVHDGNTRDFPDSALQVLIAGGHDVTLVLRHTVHKTVISVSPLVGAGQPLKPGVFGNPSVRRIFFRDYEFFFQTIRNKCTSEPRGTGVPTSPTLP